MSYAITSGRPSCPASNVASDGVWYGKVMVETMIASRVSRSMPERSIASRAAVSARSLTPTSLLARMRVMIPVRWRIHSSEESIGPTRSSLGTTRSPRAAPEARTREPATVGWAVRETAMSVLLLCGGGARMVAHQGAGGVEIVGGVEVRQGDALELALGQPGEGPGGRELDHRGDTAIAQGRHAGLPVDGGGDLVHDQLEVPGAGADHLPACVRDQRHGRIVGGQARGEGGELVAGSGHVRGVERPGDLERDHACLRRPVLRERRDLRGGARSDHLCGRVDVGRVQTMTLD